MTTSAAAPRRKRTAMEVLAQIRQPKVAVMLALGFSSGLPFLLTGNTLGYWLRDEGASLKAIGFISWVGLAYSFKYLWAPLVDRVDVPILGKWLGRRRGWMALAQIVTGLGLIGMAAVGPGGGLTAIGVFALVAAFASSTQDIVIDAWRIEAAADSDEQGLLSSAAALGYRAALIATDALILAVAARIGWAGSYVLYGVAMAIGLAATWFALEPKRADQVLQTKPPLWTPRGLFDAVIGPFIEFFREHKALGLLMLLGIAVYRLPDFVMGPMYNPYYHDLGLTKDMVAAVRGSLGLAAAIGGVAWAGSAPSASAFSPP
jgi:PAT family beta-lactamase induction signal transducer AmpG